LAFLVIAGGCHASGVDPAAVNQAVGESVRRMDSQEPIVVFGWHVEAGEGQFRWYGCSSETTCTFQDRETPAKNVISVARAGQTTVTTTDGPRAVEVEKITLSPNTQLSP
jgi:hypothetical protein